MTFRTRILLACLIVATAPLVLFVLGARRAVNQRLAAQFEARVAAANAVIREGLARNAAMIDARLIALADRIDLDAQLRAALTRSDQTAAVIDYAAAVMPTTGLDYLVLLDSAGNVLSSGHFRNDYDRALPGLPGLRAASGPALVATRRPQGRFLALVRAHSFGLGDRRLVLVGGAEVDSSFVRRLVPDEARSMLVTVTYPNGTIASRDRRGRAQMRTSGKEIVLPFLDEIAGSGRRGEARLTIAHSVAPLQEVQRGMDAWFLAALFAAVVIAALIAQLLASRVNRPLEQLADKSRHVNLDRLDVEFALQRDDEIGSLSRLLDAMVTRLRKSASQLRIAERRATVGDMARQVNHDIRNGLLPIRNVIHHLKQVAHDEPDQLGAVFDERAGTLEGGIAYLENLAANYARLAPQGERHVCDVNAVIRDVLRDSTLAERARIQLDLAEPAPRISADPVALRRIIENLTINAVESLENGSGAVTIATRAHGAAKERRVTITVADTGSGIEAAALDHIFDDFYSTRQRGSGLGLSIVRRLVTDMGGRIRVQSERGKGTTFRIDVAAQ